MKSINQSKSILLGILCAIILVSCGPKVSKVKNPRREKGLELPCSNFRSTKKLLRSNGMGESKDLNIAKKKAMSNVRTQLAGEISATMKVVGENYVKSSEFNNTEEVLEQFEETSRTIISQKLNGVKTVCERITTDKDSGNYKVYIALELSAQELVQKYEEILSKGQKSEINHNYEKFKNTFNAEMNKNDD